MILLFSVTLILIAFFHLLHKTKKPLKGCTVQLQPPGPRALPVIGNLHQLSAAKNLHLYLYELSKKFGPIIHMRLGPVPLIVVSSPKLAREVLKNQDSAFCNRPKSRAHRKLSYNHSDIIFSSYNEYFKEMRKLASMHLFSPKKVRSFRPIREEEIARMISKISSLADDRVVLNLNDAALYLGSSLICRTAFGKRYDEHGFEIRRFEKLLQDVQDVAIAFFVSDYFPAFSWVDNLTGMVRRLDETCKKLDLFYQELIDDHLHRHQPHGQEEDHDDILDVLIQLKLQQKPSSIHLGWDNVKALLMNIFIAGSETSSTVIVWTMTALMKSPKVMEKVQQEIRSVVGERGKVEEDDLANLPYLKAVISESMRLYPPVPLLVPRSPSQVCTLEGYQIRPGTRVFINSWAIARDPECWENPNEFVPERFLDNNKNSDAKQQDFEYLPFGYGRRMCPGISTGRFNVELGIANMLYSFDWELPPGVHPHHVDTEPTIGLAVQKKNPLLIVPIKYNLLVA